MVAVTLLIVDDEPTNLSLLTQLLRPVYVVRAANSGESALRGVRRAEAGLGAARRDDAQNGWLHGP
jgi:CheY-like chemotaxis protein